MNCLQRSEEFCHDYNLEVPVIMAPMAGACPVEMAAAVSNAGGMGACGALLLQPEQITGWADDFRAASNGVFMLNNWIPDAAVTRDGVHEERLKDFLAQFAPRLPQGETSLSAPDFDAQCQAMLDANPHIISSIMGLYEAGFVQEMKARDIKWFATITSVTEALAAEAAGADALVVQGHEAGGHRGQFLSDFSDSAGLMALLPAVSDAVALPLIATGGIADARGMSAALMLGASAVQIGTGLLRTPEAGISPAWAAAIETARPEDTILTRAYSGKPGRALKNRYIDAAHHPDNPEPAPYPVQRALTQSLRTKASAEDDIEMMQAWAGQAARLASDAQAGAFLTALWADVKHRFES